MNIYIDSDNVITLTGLTDQDGAPVTSATVTARLQSLTGVDIVGETWPVTMAHVGSGTYRGSLSDALEIELGRCYRCTVIATIGSITRKWIDSVEATYGGF